jgi:hypothetical protein
MPTVGVTLNTDYLGRRLVNQGSAWLSSQLPLLGCLTYDNQLTPPTRPSKASVAPSLLLQVTARGSGAKRS